MCVLLVNHKISWLLKLLSFFVDSLKLCVAVCTVEQPRAVPAHVAARTVIMFVLVAYNEVCGPRRAKRAGKPRRREGDRGRVGLELSFK